VGIIIVIGHTVQSKKKYEGGGMHRLTAYAAAAPMIILQLAGPDDCFIFVA
jgi:hypothetical protein